MEEKFNYVKVLTLEGPKTEYILKVMNRLNKPCKNESVEIITTFMNICQ